MPKPNPLGIRYQEELPFNWEHSQAGREFFRHIDRIMEEIKRAAEGHPVGGSYDQYDYRYRMDQYGQQSREVMLPTKWLQNCWEELNRLRGHIGEVGDYISREGFHHGEISGSILGQKVGYDKGYTDGFADAEEQFAPE